MMPTAPPEPSRAENVAAAWGRGTLPFVTARAPYLVLRDLCEVAAKAGVEVRIEPFHRTLAGKGGLCRVDGRRVILVDANLAVVDQVGIVGQALGRIDLGSIPMAGDLPAFLRHGRAAIAPLDVLPLRPPARARLRLVR